MMKIKLSSLAVLAAGLYGTLAIAQEKRPALAVTMTNATSGNAIQVYDPTTHNLIQTLRTGGNGGVSGNARGVRQYGNELLAVVNFGSKSVSIFERWGYGLRLARLIRTTSAPVSIDFGHNHMYVAGATTVDSFLMNGDQILFRDGSANLVLAGGGAPSVGSTAQVGVLERQLLVTLKTDPIPGTVDVVALSDSGAIRGNVTPVSAPAQSLTPFGFTVTGADSALITLAHSGELGLFRNGEFTKVVSSGAAPCWTARAGKYVLVVDTLSKSLSREVATGSNVLVDSEVAAEISTGGNPTDADVNGSFAAVVDSTGSSSHLSFFEVNHYGELSGGATTDLGTPHANGVAVMAPLR